MTTRITASSPRIKAGLAGVCYLITIGAGAFDHLFVAGRLIAPGDAAATARNLQAFAHLYRLAFAFDMIPAYAVVTVLLYELFKPANRSLSLLAAVFSFVGGAVGSALAVFQLAPLSVLGSAILARGFGAEQLQALALLFLNLYQIGFTVTLVFFGSYCFLIGWLILVSRFLPRAVGVIMALAGLGYITYCFADFLSPPLAVTLSFYTLMLGSLGEVVLTVSLFLVGLNVLKWGAAAEPRC